MRVSFAECVFDSDIRALLRSGEVVHLSPKAFRLLELLLENRPRVMSKDQIVAALWPDTFVTDGSLANLVAEVRAALADTASNPRFLRTVHRVGYSFCGDVLDAPPHMGLKEKLAPRTLDTEQTFGYHS